MHPLAPIDLRNITVVIDVFSTLVVSRKFTL